MEGQPRQMNLTESPQVQTYDVIAPLVIARHILGHSDRYSEEVVADARERVIFWSALHEAKPPEE